MSEFCGKIIKRVLVIVFIALSFCICDIEGQSVLAANETIDFHTEVLEVSKYIDGEGKRIAPKPSIAQYEDWIFAGWYRDEECTKAVNSTSGERYAKFVPSEILSVKCQVTAGTNAETTQNSALRLISTVDSFNYQEVGFELLYGFGAKKLNIPSYEVFEKIESAIEGQEYGYSPNIFSLQSKYFATATLTNISQDNFDKSFYIKPYWITLDGTKVYGVSRCARVEDSYLNIVNVPVRLYSDASVIGGNVSVAYNTTNFTYYGYDDPADLGTVTVDGATSGAVKVSKSSDTTITADGMFVNLRLQRKVAEPSLPKKNQFTVTANLTVEDSKPVVVPNVMYTHYHTTYSGTPDTSWYQDGVQEYVLTSPAELYGLADLSKKTNFYNVKIKLGADIKINSGTVEEWRNEQPTYQWENTIGINGKAFNGTFDGQGHSISGIYLNSSSQYVGLFGMTEKDSIIKDFKLVNSYFKSTATTWVRLGSIVGDMRGKSIDTVYSNAIVEGSNTQIGGLIGGANAYSVPLNVTNCQFDGEVKQTIATEAAKQYIGGIAGAVIQGTVNFTDCLNTGKVSCVYTTAASNNYGLAVGGLMGGFMNAPIITFTDCLNSGKVMTYNGNLEIVDQNGVGSIIGLVNNANVTIKCNNTYATAESSPLRLMYVDTGTVSPEPQKVATADITGYLAYSNLSGFDFYKTSTNAGAWAARRTVFEDSTPVLKSFADTNEWFDATWYYGHEADTSYEISTLAELYGLSELSTTTTNFKEKSIKLGADIVVNSGDAKEWETKAPKNSWTPIGNNDYQFNAALFDGQGHTISGIYVDTTNQYAGLFGVTTYNSNIQNLRLENSYIRSNVASNSAAFIGSIAGLAGGSFTNIYSNAIIYSTGNYCGGLVGRIDNDNTTKNKFANCWFNGELTGNQYVGGILGTLAGDGTKVVIENCLSDGDITCTKNNAAGICGYVNYGTTSTILEITNSLVTSKIRVGSPHCNNSVVGHIDKGTVKLTNVYTSNDVVQTNGTTTIYQRVDGIGNQSDSGELIGDGKAYVKNNLLGAQARYNTELDFYLSESDDGVWVAREGKTPALKNSVSKTEWYTEDETIVADISWYNENESEYVISTASELYGLSELAATINFETKNIKLGADIVVNVGDAQEWGAKAPVNIWAPISQTMSFAGTFDGQEHSISGIYLNTDEAYAGLFGQVSGTVKNLKLKNSYFNSSYTGDKVTLGSIVAYLNGSIMNVYSNANVNGIGNQIGGLIGRFGGNNTKTISECWFAGTLTSSGEDCGGLVGRVHMGTKTMQDCLNTGTVNSTKTGAAPFAGGVVGRVYCDQGGVTVTLTMNNCLSVGDVNVNYGSGVGSVMGRARNKVTFTNVYVLEGILKPKTGITIGTQSTVNGVGNYSTNDGNTLVGAPITKTSEQLKGINATQNTEGFDYTSIWSVMKDDYPVLKIFVPETEWYTGEE